MNTQKDHKNLEWLRTKLHTLWTVQKYCGLCLEMVGNFYPLTMEFAINDCYIPRPLKEVVSSVLNCAIENYTSSEVICESCIEKTIRCYVFIENTKKVFNILSTCVNDLLSKATDIDNELDENCDYKDSNVMIVVEYDNETSKNIEKITCGNNTMLTDIPVKEKISPEKPELHESAQSQHLNTKKICKFAIAPIATNSSASHTLPKSDNPENQKPVKIPLLNKEHKGPIIAPTMRVIKHPRTTEVAKRVNKPAVTSELSVSLEGGKIVIAPLNINNPSAPKYNTYKCNACPSIFTTYRSLKEHEKSLHNTTIFQCRFCVKKYNSQQYLDVHYVTTHSTTRCRHCHGLFDNNKLNSHLREKHEKRVNGCNYCDLAYYTVEQLETHIKSAHFDTESQCQTDKTQCAMCLRYFRDVEIKMHKCKFSCLECSVVPCVHYSYLMSFREQVLSHASKIRCLDCDYTTKRKEHLISHVNREHLDYHPYTCDDCGTQFYTKLSLKTHIVQFHLDMKCQYCDYEFKSSKLLESHRQLCKTITRVCACEKCVASFDTVEELNKHIELNHSDIVFPCTLCKREFPIESALEEHHARVHSGVQYKKRRKFIECTLCDITFRNIKEMNEHEKLHDSSELFPCKVCSKSFPNLKKVYLHKQKHYSKRIKCPGCRKFVSKSYYIQHKATCEYLKLVEQQESQPHISQSEDFHTRTSFRVQRQHHAKRISCEYCYKLVKPSFMKRHIEIKHTNPTERVRIILNCKYCDYTANNKIAFENHMNKIHLKVKPYVCKICNKAFCGKSRLDEHEKTHSDSHACYCSFCGKKFANKVCLKMHTRRHTGEKPYECNICQERFRSSSIMKTHRLKKHHDKTIPCPVCGTMYHMMAEMRFHVKKVHWKRPEPFDYKELVSEQYYHLFEDQRLQKLGEYILKTGSPPLV